MKKLKLLILLSICTFKLYAQSSNDFLTELPISTTLNSQQQKEFEKITRNNLLKDPHFISIGSYATANHDGQVTISLPFLPIPNVTYQTTNFDFISESDYFWYGQNFDENHTSFTLTKSEGVYSGNITFENHSYEIQDLSGGVICISELKMDNISAHECIINKDEPIAEQRTRGACEPQTTRILVIYNQDALNSNSNMQSLSQAGVNQLNTIWSNSGIVNTAVLAGAQFYNFTRTNDPVYDITNIPNNNAIVNYRAQYNADIVVLMVGEPYGGTYGIARNIGGGFDDAYCIVSATSAISGRKTFSHEITHLYGGRHDDVCDPTSTYAHGYIFRTGLFSLGEKRYTLMACLPSDKTRIDNISNPYELFHNKETGNFTYANNAGKVIGMVNTIANFIQDPGSAVDLDVTWPILANCTDSKIANVIGKCGSGPYTYLWQSSQNGVTWTNISTSTTSIINLPPPPSSNSTTTYLNATSRKYRVIVTDAYNHSITAYKNYYMSCDIINSNRLSNENSNTEFAIIPNPNNSDFTINLSEEFQNEIKLELLDMLGKVVYSQNFTNVLNKLELNNIKKLAKGSYIVKITNSLNKSKSLKLLIN